MSDHDHDRETQGWLFKLSTTLGARHAHPAWPASRQPADRMPGADGASRDGVVWDAAGAKPRKPTPR